MRKLMAFTVVSHTRRHETTTTVIAETKWDASLAVELPMATDEDLVELLEECRAAIEAAGVTVRG